MRLIELWDEGETANVINQFFSTVGDRVSEQIEPTEFTQLDGRVQISFNQFTPMTQNDLLEIVKDIGTSKSSDIKDLSGKLVVDSIHSIPEVYVKICLLLNLKKVNLSLSKGEFPGNWKLARVAPISKKGNVQGLDNLQPTFIVSIIGKILEKFVKKQLVDFFESNELS